MDIGENYETKFCTKIEKNFDKKIKVNIMNIKFKNEFEVVEIYYNN